MVLQAVLLVALSSAILASAQSPLNPAELARTEGYDAEDLKAQTADGHLLGVFRIRNSSSSSNSSNSVYDKDPVLIVPGLACNAAIWVLLGRGKALAYLLADRGYDVYIADHRGGMFSRSHINLTDSDASFWDFSLDDVGRLDLPALLQLVRRHSGRPSVTYIGHSMGASVLTIAADAGAAGAVSRAYMLAPAAYMGHASHPAVYGSATTVSNLHMGGFGLFRSGEIPLGSWWAHAAIRSVCSTSLTTPICILIPNVYAGHDSQQINTTAIPFYAQYIPDSIGIKNVQHFIQHFGKNFDFRRFDYGSADNLANYGQEQPPQYNLSTATFPISIYYGSNDYLVNPLDVLDFAKSLPNIARPPYRIPYDKFTHLDFFLGMNTNTFLYDQIIRDLEEDERHAVTS